MRWTLALVVAITGCGARSGLLTEGSAGTGAECRGGAPWILFDVLGESGSSSTTMRGIHAMRTDGSDEHAVVLPHGPGLYPWVSRDGTQLLYASYPPADAGSEGGPDSALYLHDLSAGTDTLVVKTTHLSYSALSPDGRTVAYVSAYSLHALATDGTGDRTLLAGPNGDGTGYGHPAFLADPHTIVYATGGRIGAIQTDGSGDRTLLTTIPGSLQYPNPGYSPDGSHLVVGSSCGRDAPDALRIFASASLPGAACGSGQLLVAVNDGASPNAANDPAWGADGRIAYASGADVYLIDATGGTPTDLTASLTGDGGTLTASDPVWAPACTRIP